MVVQWEFVYTIVYTTIVAFFIATLVGAWRGRRSIQRFKNARKQYEDHGLHERSGRAMRRQPGWASYFKAGAYGFGAALAVGAFGSIFLPPPATYTPEPGVYKAGQIIILFLCCGATGFMTGTLVGLVVIRQHFRAKRTRS